MLINLRKRVFRSYRNPTSTAGELNSSSESLSQARQGTAARPKSGRGHDMATNTPPFSIVEIGRDSGPAQLLRPSHNPLSRHNSNVSSDIAENGASPILRHKNEAKFAAENQSSIRNTRLRKQDKPKYK